MSKPASTIVKIAIAGAAIAALFGAAQLGILLWQLNQLPARAQNFTGEEKTVLEMARFLEHANAKEHTVLLGGSGGASAPLESGMAAAPAGAVGEQPAGRQSGTPPIEQESALHRQLALYLHSLDAPDRPADADAQLMSALRSAPGEAVSAIGSLMVARGGAAGENRQRLTAISKAFVALLPDQAAALRDELRERIHAAGAYDGTDDERRALVDDLTAAYSQFAKPDEIAAMKTLVESQDQARAASRDGSGRTQQGMPDLAGTVAPGPVVESGQ